MGSEMCIRDSDSCILKAEIQGSSIDNVEIVEAPKALSDVTNIIYSLNNTNGSGIETCMSSTSGILTCFITTPITGFATPPFAVGDKVFVEGIVNIGSNTTETGFNSEDYGFKFFNISDYDASVNPVKVEIDLSQYVTNAGLAVTNQNGYASITNQSNYPTFKVTQQPLDFIEGETFAVEAVEGGKKQMVIVESKDRNLSPHIEIVDSSGSILAGGTIPVSYTHLTLPTKA